MASGSRKRVPQAALPVVAPPAAGRRLPLRVLFVHSDAVKVRKCLQELQRASFNVSADVARTPEQFARRLKSRVYDVVVAEYPSVNWQGMQLPEILRARDRRIP